MDYLHVVLCREELLQMSALGLAHIGDGVYELMVRSFLCKEGVSTAKGLHKKTVALVSAKAQAAGAAVLTDRLTDAERDVFLRGRNAKVHSSPKGADLETYHAATALECLFGYLFLSGEYDRLNELFELILQKQNGFSER